MRLREWSLPVQVLLFSELRNRTEWGACKLLAYNFAWVVEHLSLAGVPPSAIVHYKPHSLHYAERVLVASPSALDAPHLKQLLHLRKAVIPNALGSAIAAAANAGVSARRKLLIVQLRKSGGRTASGEGSVHGEARELTNWAQLIDALEMAARSMAGTKRGDSDLEVCLVSYATCAASICSLRRSHIARLCSMAGHTCSVQVLVFEHKRHSVAEQVTGDEIDPSCLTVKRWQLLNVLLHALHR